MKKGLYILGLCLVVGNISAQQEAMFTNYMFYQLSINPAYAGTNDGVSVTALHRSQWVSFDGAPSTQVISGHMPIKDENIGLGLSIYNDKVGPTQNLGIAGDFSYKLKLGSGNLRLGLKAAANFVSVGLTELKTVSTNDASFSENVSSGFLPNFGFGGYYSTEKYYAGVSIPKLLENGFDVGSPSIGVTAISSEKRHYYLLGGAIIDINTNLKIEPSTFIKVTAGAPIQADLTALFRYKNRFWAGPNYRLGDALGLLLGMEVIENLEFGYSFDWSFANRTFNNNLGSHEIMLRYQISARNKGVGRIN
jgi:type IX secretion system PorP/SprF family membrane protein